MSEANIHKILELKSKHHDIESINVHYDTHLIITFSFVNPCKLPWGVFALIYQTVKHYIPSENKMWSVSQENDTNRLIFIAEDDEQCL